MSEFGHTVGFSGFGYRGVIVTNASGGFRSSSDTTITSATGCVSCDQSACPIVAAPRIRLAAGIELTGIGQMGGSASGYSEVIPSDIFPARSSAESTKRLERLMRTSGIQSTGTVQIQGGGD